MKTRQALEQALLALQGRQALMTLDLFTSEEILSLSHETVTLAADATAAHSLDIASQALRRPVLTRAIQPNPFIRQAKALFS